jgi:hypothetical protein
MGAEGQKSRAFMRLYLQLREVEASNNIAELQ